MADGEDVSLLDLTSMSLGDALDDDDDPRRSFREEDDDLDDGEGEASLEDWITQYTPLMMGVEYVKVLRVHPQTYRGVPTGGVLEQVYDPICESDLSMKWGGGTFRLQVFKTKNGRTKVVDERNVQVSGFPTHFRGTDGDPQPIPGLRRGRQDSPQERLLGRQREVQQNSLHGALGRSRAEVQAETERTRLLMEQNKGQQGLLLDLLKSEREKQAQQQGNAVQAQTAMMQPFQHAIGAVQSQMAALQASHSSTLEGLRTNHSEQMRAMQDTLNTYRDEAARREREIRDEASRREQQMLQDYRDRMEVRIEQVKQNGEAQLREARSALRAAEERHGAMMESERRHYDSNKQLQTGSIKAQFEGTVNLLTVENNRLRAETDRLRDEVNGLRNKAMNQDDPLTALTKATSLVDQVRGTVGGDMPQVGEDAGFFGKLMQAAPVVSKAMAPILERVDKAAALGEESLRQQQQAMMQQQTMPPAMGYNPMQATQGLHQPAPGYQTAPPMPPETPQQHQPPPQAPAPAPPQQQGMGNPTENFGEFLTWMDQQVDSSTPEDIATQIKAGVGAGVVPAEFVQGILQEDPDSIVSQIHGAANEAGLDSLGSPLGKTILSRTLMELRK